MMQTVIVCTPRFLPREQWVDAAQKATEINPVNHPPIERLMGLMSGFVPTKEHIAVLTTKYWGNQGVRLTVSFLDSPPTSLRKRILLHMNAWAKTANVKFVATATTGDVRIARSENSGYWSYLGTDIRSIPSNKPTMNLEAFAMTTIDSEFHRVVRHETGHTLGFPHEHMRRELVDRIDRDKAIEYFSRTQGWSREEVIRQVLTPLEESSLLGTVHADPKSIMCYQIPGALTKNGQPIVGGADIDRSDYVFAAKIYPKPKAITKPKLLSAANAKRKAAPKGARSRKK